VTFERDFDTTIAFYQLEGVISSGEKYFLIRAVNRQLRRKFRQALSFGSAVGAEVALYLQVQRLMHNGIIHFVADFSRSLLGFAASPHPLDKDTIIGHLEVI